MHIIHVTECLAGGVLTFLINLTSQLKNEEHVIIYGKRDNTPADVQSLFGSNVHLIHWKTAQREIRPQKDISALFELLHILKEIPDIDILQLHSSKAGVLGRIVARILGLQDKTFYLPHGVAFARQDVSKIKRNCYVLAEKIADQFAGTVIACSNSEKELLIRNGISNVIVINNGIAIPDSEPEYKVPGRPLVFGTVGRITSQKNPYLFNKIAKHFRNNPEVKFVWIGDGELKNEIELADNIEITGWVNAQEVKSYLKKIDVYISTSLWEGLPLSVLEAMRLGKPVLLRACVGNIDLVDGNGYIFCNSKEAIQMIQKFLCIDTAEFIFFSKNSFIKAKNEYSLERMKSKYLKLYYKKGSI